MIMTLLVLHLAAAVVAPTLVRVMGSKAFWPLAIVPAATAVWAAMQLAVTRGQTYEEHLRWVDALDMQLTFRMDSLGWLMTLIVSAIGALVLLYCASYMADDDGNLGLLAGSLVGFAGAMLGLVTADDLLILYIFWEITTVLSYLLVGYLTTAPASTRAAKQALIVTTFGGLAMLVGIVMLGESADTYRISQIVADPVTGTIGIIGIVLLLVGAITKSALIPFHFWLPGAMAAPTPVSAYLHAAAMVKAGVYLVARFAPGYADLTAWQVTVLVLGSGTMILGAVRATRQTDLKLLLAYGTVSQLGFLTILLGYGSKGAMLAGLTMIISHSLFKAGLFLTVGTIDHSAGTRDIRRLGGVARRAPILTTGAVLAAGSMAGLPIMIGFVGKEAALGALLYPEHGWFSLQGLAAVSVVFGSVLTMAYSARFIWGAFTDGALAPYEGSQRPKKVVDWHEPGPLLVGIPVLLALAGVVMGLISPAFERALDEHVQTATLVPDVHEVHLGLWHGLSLPLFVSIAIWLAGGLWWWVQSRRPVEVPIPLVPFDAGRTYHSVMRLLDRVALETTGFMARGSLPVLLGIILAVMVVLPGLHMIFGPVSWPTQWRVADSAAQIGIGLIIVTAALLATRARRRLRAVFLVGTTGYGISLLFLLHGAPDLALTQVLVETVQLVVLVLVLRRLSGRFPDDPTPLTRRLRAGMGVAVGLMFFAATSIAVSSRMHSPAGSTLEEAALEYGAGKNIVNVILVDVRAWDTMGELSVVLACATGVASLIFLRDENLDRVRETLRNARGTFRMLPIVPGPSSSARISRWITAGDRMDPYRRSTILEVVTRLVFHTIMLWSVYLLLAGHNMPGGGFAAGLIGGLGVALRYLAGRGAELRMALPVMPAALLGTGMFIAAGSALIPMLFGSPALRTWDAYLQLPFLGEVHIVTSLLFDVGVYLVVLGLMLDILRSFGSAIDQQISDHREREGANR